jgi:type II secretory pathway pseudopilin PulG
MVGVETKKMKKLRFIGGRIEVWSILPPTPTPRGFTRVTSLPVIILILVLLADAVPVFIVSDNKDIQLTVKTQQYYCNLLLQGYIFRLLRVIIRTSNELTQEVGSRK